MKYRNDLKRRVLAGLFAGAALYTGMAVHAAGPAADIIANDTLPQGHHDILGNITIKGPDQFNNRPVMVITQKGQNGVIKWDSFNVGANAAVTFDGDTQGFNTLNYVTGEHGMSQIYGAIDATNGGNIYIVNPAGVEIGSSAQINVGSLYVSNKKMDDAAFTDFMNHAGTDNFVVQGTTQDAVLMSLGNVNAANVTFDGGRIVIDTENLRNTDGHTKLTAGDITVRTTDEDNVILGYDAYVDTDADKDGVIDEYKGANNPDVNLAKVNNGYFTKADGYMWIDDVEQLQAVNTNLGGNYALRSSIDATATRTWNDEGTENTNRVLEGFRPIGMDEKGNVITTVEDGKTHYGFYGKFDGLGNHIFDLTIDRAGQDKVGLFGTVHDASISNVNLVSGSITGGKQVGGLIGAALGSSRVAGVTTGADVAGSFDVGGLIGYAGDFSQSTGAYQEAAGDGTFTDLVNTGTVKGGQTGGEPSESDGNNVGGLIGYLYGGSLGGDSYNLGNVTTSGHNAGGLVGRANEAKIGDGQELVYNRLTVTGAYNVGGIVGNMESSTVQNAENSGTVTADGYTEETYEYHTDNPTADEDHDGLAQAWVHVANAGGIAGSASGGSTIGEVLNTGDVASGLAEGEVYYAAGNVGGIAGSAVDTEITNATNRENEIRGAHNVGGIAGYFASENSKTDAPVYKISASVNDGGDVMATGARNDDGFVTEQVRNNPDKIPEIFIIGNMGGIAGYMDGNQVFITGSVNRGTVHTMEFDYGADGAAPEYARAANAGGIVGKIDQDDRNTLEEIKQDAGLAEVSNSYNTGDVRGYTGVGGIAGMMYNGEIAHSYNEGTIQTTRQANHEAGSIDPLNMGGIVGDATEDTTASAVLYDVFNKGQIGDATYTYFGRHVGGVAGRFSGTIDKSYNAGEIYNGFSVVGGIVGWLPEGTVTNSFNTGNITVVNTNDAESQVGGIVGGADVTAGPITISNVYNLGTLRSFRDKTGGANALGGILGFVSGNNGHEVSISNAYTTGNIYAAKIGTWNDSYSAEYITDSSMDIYVGSIWGMSRDGAEIQVDKTYYITPSTTSSDGNSFHTFDKDIITGNRTYGMQNANHVISYGARFDKEQWADFVMTDPKENGGIGADIEGENTDWRWYDNSTPILNAFLPNTEDYFAGEKEGITPNLNGIDSIQYGTAYDPLLTIIHADKDVGNLSFDWTELGMNDFAGLAVYGAGLTLEGIQAQNSSGYFSGTLYSDGILSISSTDDVLLGSASQLYGSAVQIETDGTVTAFGSIHATANVKDGTTGSMTEKYYKKEDGEIKPGDVSITGGEVNLYGTVNSSEDALTIPGIASMADTFEPGEVANPDAAMDTIGGRFSYETIPAVDESDKPIAGNIAVTATEGDVNLYYGEEERGMITSDGSLTVTAEQGNIYSDTDLHIDGNITFDASGEKVFDLTNIGKVQGQVIMAALERALQQNGFVMADAGEISANETEVTGIIEETLKNLGMDESMAGELKEKIVGDLSKSDKGVDALKENISVNIFHDLMHEFGKEGGDGSTVHFKGSGDNKLTIDMWDYESGAFDLDKYDSEWTDHSLKTELDNLNFTVEGDETAAASKYTYIWVADGDQLAGIQQYYNDHWDAPEGTGILGYNFALKNDIDASQVEGYEAIGAGAENGYTGTFDGRGNRIINLDTTKKSDGTSQTLANAGVFDTIGEYGVVKDVNIYSGRFTAVDNAGAVAAVNKGTIEDVSLFSNRVEAFGSENSTNLGTETEAEYVGAAGGVAGVNTGAVSDIHAAGIILAGEAGQEIEVAAGGLAGVNSGTLSGSRVQSAVTADSKYTYALGGAAGVNMGSGSIDRVHSFGTVSGVYLHNHGQGNGDGEKAAYSDQIGGIAGVNQDTATISNVYNAGRVSGRDDVGGIVGKNTSAKENDETFHSIYNAVNSADIRGEAADGDTSDYVGGLVGSNDGHITNGRNNGRVNGNQYVGGLVGENLAGSVLKDLVNDASAFITGDNYVGGIAGSNAGEITVSTLDDDGQPAGNENAYLVNRGTITGQMYVGGVAGVNTGTITNTNNNVTLNVKDKDEEAKYFGGVAGINGSEDGKDEGIIKNATNSATIIAENADYVGGIVGWNTIAGKLEGMGNSNEGRVEGASHVGGVAGRNDAEIDGSKTEEGTVGIFNSGVVIAHKGGAGGIFGENTGVISHAELTNNGIVSGTYSDEEGENGTGGIFGVNRGDVTYSSLKNEINGQVMGTQNVGGLIGVNTGDITGGRTEADGTDVGYYKYQIYNNGTITVEGNGTNIGGLIGTNDANATITAGYNTGAIDAENSTHVGGIAGTNAGKLDQVFNTVMNADGTAGSITGSTHVGGIAGSNEAGAEISNAYNTTGVIGEAEGAVIGAIAGANGGTIKNVYGSGTLVGSGSGSVSNVYDAGSNSFGEGGSSIDFNGEVGFIWRQYGENNPILKVFLTTVTYDPQKNEQEFTYNGKDQQLDIGNLIATGAFSAADNFAAHNNVSNGLISHDNETSINAGTYTDDFWSEQIKAGGTGDTFNPNNLGYDVQSVKYTIDQKELTITLNDVFHEYGTPDLDQYGFTVNGWVDGEDFSKDIHLSDIADGALKDNNTHTADVGDDYTWTANAYINGTLGQGGAGNYKLAVDSETGLKGNSEVTQATVQVSLKDVAHIYGNTWDSKDYGIAGDIAWVNGDKYTNADVSLSDIKDTAFDTETGHTNNAGGDYYWTANVAGAGTDAGRINQNYNFEVVKGDSVVNRKGLTVSLGEVTHTYGTPTKDGYTFKVSGWAYDEDYSEEVSIGTLGQGIVDHALKDENQHTQDVGDYTWTTDRVQIGGDGASNYYIGTVTNGASKVTPVTIDVQLGNVSHEYGSLNDQYGFAGTVAWVNGDQYTNANISLSDIDDAADLGNGKTNNVGQYHWSAVVSAAGDEAERIEKNYIFNVIDGTSEVTPKDLFITVDDKEIYAGEALPEFTGQMGQLVNGDMLPDGPVYSTNPEEAIDTTQTGTHTIGVQFGDNYVGTADDSYDWTKIWDGFKNYDVIFDSGTLKVMDWPSDVVEPPVNEHWNFLFDDDPWGRNRDFRERKANIHFIAGGMTL